ncbi:hydroxyacylglutathione hydrolase [Roseovarius sp. THAF9]|uniref:MBL fold metallo-hydrolase n=1 Tax=Roseovarius sp. THAF9 TaxID=2587847 RepID=UPI0012A82FCA|nr:MBL fold metallo-hydrolase [Roseovarius sp. THAF9]QFT92225.1 hydroxyacylglutathione hydrolase [Roseovarius sp. THAF9]
MPLIVAEKWFQTRDMGDGVTLIWEPHVAPWLRCNIWHIQGRDRDLVIDTGMGLRPMTRELAQLTERPLSAIVTHTHFDHSGGLNEFDHRCGHSAESDIIANPTPANTYADAGFVRAETFTALPFEGFSYELYTVKPAPLSALLDEGDVIDLGDRVFTVFHLPGHSPGSIALHEAKTGLLFSGDVVYDGDLIDDMDHSDPEMLADSHARLRELDVITVHAGHFKSFGRDKMIEILDEYRDGGRRLGDADAWLADMIARSRPH